MNYFDFSFWQNFGSNLLATIIGVALGIPVAFWINNITDVNTKREKKSKILASLFNELDNNKNVLDSLVENQESVNLTDKMYGALLMDEVWDTFSDGGELQWISDGELLGYLSTTYGKIKQVKYLYDLYLHWNSIANTPQGPIRNDLRDAIQGAYVYLHETLDRISKDKDVKPIERPGVG